MINWPLGGMADTADLKSASFGSPGSSPGEATNYHLPVGLVNSEILIKFPTRFDSWQADARKKNE